MLSPSFSRSVRRRPAACRCPLRYSTIWVSTGVSSTIATESNRPMSLMPPPGWRESIGAQQRELFAGGFRRRFRAHQVVAAPRMRFWLRLASNMSAWMRTDTQADAALAGGTIGDGLAAAETRKGEGLGQGLGQVAAQAGKDLALGSAGQIGARPAGVRKNCGMRVLRWSVTSLKPAPPSEASMARRAQVKLDYIAVRRAAFSCKAQE